jgi:hypothetical protein
MVYEFRRRDNYEYRLIIGDSRTGNAYKFDFEDVIEKDSIPIDEESINEFYEFIKKYTNNGKKA